MAITYLVGAGASADVLPVVKKLEDELIAFGAVLNSKFGNAGQDINSNFTNVTGSWMSDVQAYESLYKKVNWLITEIKNVASIDTLAKRLRITEDFESLNDLIGIITVFFKYLQYTKSISPRHDSFFASILGTTSELPNGLNILTWNYDSQYELAYSRFLSKHGHQISDTRNKLNFSSPWGPRKEIGPVNYLKINGSADFKIIGQDKSLEELYGQKPKDELLDILVKQFFAHSEGRLECGVKFAWDSEEYSEYLDHIQKVIQNTKILIIIGYSFPHFNKAIDTRIFRNLEKIESIYIQDLYPKDVHENLLHYGLVKPGRTKGDPNVIYIENTSQFFIHPSL